MNISIFLIYNIVFFVLVGTTVITLTALLAALPMIPTKGVVLSLLSPVVLMSRIRKRHTFQWRWVLKILFPNRDDTDYRCYIRIHLRARHGISLNYTLALINKWELFSIIDTFSNCRFRDSHNGITKSILRMMHGILKFPYPKFSWMPSDEQELWFKQFAVNISTLFTFFFAFLFCIY